MTNQFAKAGRRALVCGAAVAAILTATPVFAQEQLANIDIAAQPMDAALKELAKQSGANLLFSPDAVRGLRAKSLQTTATPEDAARMLLAGTDLFVKKDATGSLLVDRAAPQSGSAAEGGAEVATVIVTAQKREEDIQDVPIAISAFSQTALEEQKIEGGFDLLKAIPNVTFSKTNFTSYNFSIRGVGTKAISATTDPGVAVAFNNTTLIHNRLFEQEYFDVERVEVLRGPQGTLFGRNATSGVINLISKKANTGGFEGSIKGEIGNYHSKRLSGFVNIPLIEDVLAVRLAGAMTDRQGYDFNSITGHPVNGRDLWSARFSVHFQPTEKLRSDFIWERFNEDDDRSRTGKQLCHHDATPTMIGSTPSNQVPGGNPLPGSETYWNVIQPAMFSQGCRPGSLYDDAAFGTPNGLALPFVFAPLYLGSDCGVGCTTLSDIGNLPSGRPTSFLKPEDPYRNMMQSRDLREIASVRDPIYRANSDVLELNLEIGLSDALTFFSQTAYIEDEVYSFQDFNRFNSEPVFIDTTQLTKRYFLQGDYRGLAPGGIFCDPQIGCTNRIAGFDISEAKSKQFNQEFRLQSDFSGAVNFSVGANYTKFDTLNEYYVFYNLITMIALTPPFYNPGDTGLFDGSYCHESGVFVDPSFGLGSGPVAGGDPAAICPYVDSSPIENLQGDGHNYFRSKNPYGLKSYAAFGEMYWTLTDALKLTAGLRYTKDEKRFVPVPSQVLLAGGLVAGGTVSRGYPEKPAIEQEWGEWTGRIGLDWKPDLHWTDDTLLYGFYSRGYKGGGANPAQPGFATASETADFFEQYGEGFLKDFYVSIYRDPATEPVLKLSAVEYGPTFEPEFVNAFEIGAKNTLADGALTMNMSAFYYDYKDYQVSQIRDRIAVNENFDATIWGLEFESRFAPSRNLQIVGNIGYLDTSIADGESSIDIMNRTQSDPNYTLVKSWPQLPSNCVLPTSVVEDWLHGQQGLPFYVELCGLGGILGGGAVVRDPNYGGAPYDYNNYPELNGGAGLRDDLGGNELPNAPHWTANLGAQYGMELQRDWRVTVRGDAYWQSQSWARVYNAVNDKLHGWYNVNLSVWFEKRDDDLKIEFYAKNLLDKTPITDAFLNSDDTALTTNVFVLDPRLIGLSIRKGF